MIGGVNFQPGQSGSQDMQKPKPDGNAGVQEAIKVLSLRLPKVVGARAMAPQALLESPGSGGNSRVDSVVSQVMGRMFPTGAPPAPSAPMVPPPSAPSGPSAAPDAPAAPSFSGSVTPTTPLSSMVPREAFAPDVARAPRITPIEERPGQPTGPIMPGNTHDGTKTEISTPTSPTDGTGDPMNDFLEFLRRNQGAKESPGGREDAPI